ncbi:MAG: DUF4920 domain-containing protein [Persicimonas sp.]
MKHFLIPMAALLIVFAAGCDTDKSSGDKGAEEETGEAEPAEEPSEEDSEAESEQADDQEADEDDSKPELAEDLEAGESGEYGGDFRLEDDAISLAEAMDSAADGDTGPYKIEASVRKVCKKKGCWFTIEDDQVDETVRVRMKDYGFFVPRNLDKGARAVIEGDLRQREVPKEEAQHYADDEVAGSDKEAERIEEDQKRWEMKISAARMEQPG